MNNLKSILNNDEAKQVYLDSVRPEYQAEALDDEFLDKIAAGSGRWFLPDNTTVGVCDDCKRYTFKKKSQEIPAIIVINHLYILSMLKIYQMIMI